jgi:hypothetical protein
MARRGEARQGELQQQQQQESDEELAENENEIGVMTQSCLSPKMSLEILVICSANGAPW